MKKGSTLTEFLTIFLIISILGTTLISIICSRSNISNANYKIDHAGRIYYAESYTKENYGQCIYLSEQEKRICGDYVIEKLNFEEEY